MSIRTFFAYLKPPRTVKVTTYGKRLIVFTIVLGAAAVNTGNNLLYLVVAMLLSLVIISGMLSELSLKGIAIERSFPKHIFAQKTFYAHWLIKNGKRFSSFSIDAKEELEQDCLEGGRCYFIKVSPGTSTKGGIPYSFKNRGRYLLTGITISTSFPFGIFLKSKNEKCNYEVIVYPPIRSLEHLNLKGTATSRRILKRIKAKSGEIHSLRDYIPGEDARSIHWKSSARASRLLSKEFEREEGKRVTIIFNDNTSQKKGEHFYVLFETSVEFAASLATVLIGRGYSVAIKTSRGGLPCRNEKEHLYRILGLLALIEPIENKGRRPVKREKGSSTIVVGPRASDLTAMNFRGSITFAMDRM
ncbi:MAG: DUF58 domain-containing protein [Thermodesulfobacteriota bacterium]